MAINNLFSTFLTGPLHGLALAMFKSLSAINKNNASQINPSLAGVKTSSKRSRVFYKQKIKLDSLLNPVPANLIMMLFLKSIEANNIANNNTATLANFAAREATKKLDIASQTHTL